MEQFKEFINSASNWLAFFILLPFTPLIIYLANKDEKEWQKKFEEASEEERTRMLIIANDSENLLRY